MINTNFVIFKKQEGESFNAYSFIDDWDFIVKLRTEGVIELIFEYEKKEIYSKDDIRDILKNLTDAEQKKVKLDI